MGNRRIVLAVALLFTIIVILAVYRTRSQPSSPNPPSSSTPLVCHFNEQIQAFPIEELAIIFTGFSYDYSRVQVNYTIMNIGNTDLPLAELYFSGKNPILKVILVDSSVDNSTWNHFYFYNTWKFYSAAPDSLSPYQSLTDGYLEFPTYLDAIPEAILFSDIHSPSAILHFS